MKKILKKIMKKILLIIAVVLIFVLIVGGIGLGKGSGTGDGDSSAEKNQQEVVESEKTKDTEKSSQEANENSVIVEITVMESDYFYKNERISLEDFVKAIQELQGKVIVEVKDDNASLKAYNNLLAKLKELKIAVSEQ